MPPSFSPHFLRKWGEMEGGNIRMVDPRVGADEAEAVLDDDRSNAHAQDFIALAQHQFHDARVFLGLARQLPRAFGCRDGGEIHHPSLGFADDLGSDDKDVAIFQRDI